MFGFSEAESSAEGPNFQFPTLEELIPELENALIFTKEDCKNRIWQFKLDEESSKLTTFWTLNIRQIYKIEQRKNKSKECYDERVEYGTNSYVQKKSRTV